MWYFMRFWFIRINHSYVLEAQYKSKLTECSNFNKDMKHNINVILTGRIYDAHHYNTG